MIRNPYILSLIGKQHTAGWKSHTILPGCCYDLCSETLELQYSTVELDDWWKLIYSVLEPTQFTQARVGILICNKHAGWVDQWFPLGGYACSNRS